MRTVRKVKKGQVYEEYGSANNFRVLKVSRSTGFAEGSTGKKVRLSRLASTKWYRLIG